MRHLGPGPEAGGADAVAVHRGGQAHMLARPFDRGAPPASLGPPCRCRWGIGSKPGSIRSRSRLCRGQGDPLKTLWPRSRGPGISRPGDAASPRSLRCFSICSRIAAPAIYGIVGRSKPSSSQGSSWEVPPDHDLHQRHAQSVAQVRIGPAICLDRDLQGAPRFLPRWRYLWPSHRPWRKGPNLVLVLDLQVSLNCRVDLRSPPACPEIRTRVQRAAARHRAAIERFQAQVAGPSQRFGCGLRLHPGKGKSRNVTPRGGDGFARPRASG